MVWISWNLLCRNGVCVESLEGGAGLGGEANREVRVELEGAFQEGDCLRRLTPSGGDHSGVEAQQRVLRAEAKRFLAGFGRAVEIAAAVEGPGEDVPSDDTRPHRDLCPGLCDRARQILRAAVIGGEEGQLEISVDAVR